MREFLLHRAAIYTTFQHLTGAGKARKDLVEKLELKAGDKILDIGCGPADILRYLPADVQYTGFDNNENYIRSAKKQFKNRGNFFCQEVGADLLKNTLVETNSFNVVLATGILHHLADDQAISLFELAKAMLIKGGKLVTLDGCFTKNQRLVAKFVLRLDRGKFVRTKQEYIKLAKYHFSGVKTEISDNALKIPYTLIIMECRSD
ncbi:MAG: methyltransferase domain-containing protein [Thermoleophilia bacterium]|nr:methyltransferase domain-containing protein [Thermoleophilia bacterium]